MSYYGTICFGEGVTNKMKRDLILLRKILLFVENSDIDIITIEDMIIEEYSPKEISYHVQLLIDAGYIDAKIIHTLSQLYSDFMIKRLTMDGHDFIDSIRDDKVFKKALDKIGNSTSSLSLDIVKAVAIKIISEFLGL